MVGTRKERRAQIGLLILTGLSAYYLYRAVSFRFFTPGQLGESLFDKQIWFVAHLLFALPVIIGAPLQFVTQLGQTRPALHRTLGKFYVVGSVGAALTALYLGATIEYQGSRVPIVLLALLWLFFTVLAWQCAVRKQYAAHRLVMIRSYGLALVLVWLRLMGDVPEDKIFWFIDNQDIRDTTLEWMSWVIPLIAIEYWISWRPLLAKGTTKLRAPANVIET